MEEINPHSYGKADLLKIRYIVFYNLKIPYVQSIPTLNRMQKAEFIEQFQRHLQMPIDIIDRKFEIIAEDMFDENSSSMNLKNKYDILVKEGRKAAPDWQTMESYENGQLQPSFQDRKLQDTADNGLIKQLMMEKEAELGMMMEEP
jgi:hypothetical protein